MISACGTKEIKGFYPLGATEDAFNKLLTKESAPFVWKDRVEVGARGWIEDGEINFTTEEAKKKYLDENGKLNAAFWSKAADVARPAFKALNLQLLTDRGRNGNTWNDNREDACHKQKWRGGKEDEDMCVKIERAIVDCDGNDHLGIYKCGDLHGNLEQLPRLKALGFEAIWLSSWKQQSIAVGWGEPEKSYSSYHGFWPRDISSERIDWHLQDPNMSDAEFIRKYVSTVNAAGMEVIEDLAFATHIEDRFAAVVEGGLEYYNGKPVADWYDERIKMGLLEEEDRNKYKKWRYEYLCRKDKKPLPGVSPSAEECKAFWNENSSSSDLDLADWRDEYPENFFLHTKGCSPMRGTLTWDVNHLDRLGRCSLYGLERPNMVPGGAACETYKKSILERDVLKDLNIGGRLDAYNYYNDNTCGKELVKAYRDAADGPVTVIGEYYGILNQYDFTHSGIPRFILDPDPAKRSQLYFFGARDALRGAFADDNGSLAPMQSIIDIYREYGFSPEIMANLPVFVDNHDDAMLADFPNVGKTITRATNDDIINAHLAMTFTQSPIYVYYASLELARGPEEGWGVSGRASDPYNRPKVNPGTDPDPKTWNSMERAAGKMGEFRKKHFKAIGFGAFEGGILKNGMFGGKKVSFGDDSSFAVKRKFQSDEVLELVLRGKDGKRPEEMLKDIKVDLPNGLWKDTLTGIEFICSNGRLWPSVGEYTDEVNGRKIKVQMDGTFTYEKQSWLNRASGASYEIDGTSAKLPDGKYQPVNPKIYDGEESTECNPQKVYEGEDKFKYDPYKGCIWIDVKDGKIVGPRELPKGVEPEISVRKIKTDKGEVVTLSDGQYFFDSGKGWEETLTIKDGKVQVMPNTRVFLLEKSPFCQPKADPPLAEKRGLGGF